MDRNEMISDVLILIIATAVGFGIAYYFNSMITNILFVVIFVLAMIYIVRNHKDCIYVCKECGTKHKVGLLADLESLTTDDGDKVLKCKKCKKKTIFRRA